MDKKLERKKDKDEVIDGDAGKEDAGNGVVVKRDDEGVDDNIKEISDSLRKQKKVKIIIPSSESERDDVVVGICGYTYIIKRDHPVSVPESVVKVLRDAVVTQYKQVPRPDGNGNELVPYQSPRYPFQVIE